MNYNLSSITKNSLQLVYENSNLPEEISQHQDMNKDQMNQLMDTISNIMKSESNEDINFTLQNTLQCPICVFTTSNRSKFTEHLISHCTSKCNNSNFKAVLAQLPVLKFLQDKTNCSFPTLEECIVHETEQIDESKLFHVNLQNNNVKQKQNKESKTCKQCNFIANTKMEYWEHMRCHIKGFTCSECSFVTKYKHHMNHHWLSVHDGSKPFKCKKCSYTCVSKSMLTSHLKKHSNVYPYRCANCTYKTKFCNALKKHLRKKEHQPAMVLNADGSPNPLSIIDVYGTKRGPKQKPSVEKQDELDQNTNQNMTVNNDQLSSAPTSPILSPIARYLTLNGIENSNWTTQNSMKQNQSVVTFPYNDLIAAFNLSNHLLLENAAFNENLQELNHTHIDTLMEYVKIMKMPEEYVQNLPITCFDTNHADKLHISDNVKTTSESSTFMTLKTQLKSQKDESIDAPLDLRIAEVIGKNQFQFQLLATNSSKIIGTNKRKGRAMKLERRTMEENAQLEQKEVESLKCSINGSNFQEENQNIKDNKDKVIIDSTDTEHICHYCEITFGNVVMYTMHMGCHGFDDPYTCNMCGHHCTDKLSFFLHIARSQHS